MFTKKQKEKLLMDFLFHLNDKNIIDNYSFDYEQQVNSFLKSLTLKEK